MRIRRASREDRGAIERLVELGAKDVRKRIGPHPCPVPIEDLGARGVTALVAEEQEKIVGSVAYRIRGGRMHFFNLVVDAKHRNNGIAKMLVAELETIARNANAKHMTLQTIGELGVEQLFVRFGFRVQSSKKEFLFANDRENALTTVYMVKRLGKFPTP
ncbi:MAG: GNAT family N-acetyltransferase [Candidatus Hydrogenedentes bacterium]|nr:GNAT family N-acetyltransferase [Candidatus Hydrogenedentota bacterium]